MRTLLARLRPQHVAVAQGAYYAPTGVWPILHIRSFLLVTGPKEDLWLVQSFGALILVIGVTLLLAARRDRLDATARFLGLASALAFVAVDLVFHLGGHIPSVYLLDGAVQILLAFLWVATGRRPASD